MLKPLFTRNYNRSKSPFANLDWINLRPQRRWISFLRMVKLIQLLRITLSIISNAELKPQVPRTLLFIIYSLESGNYWKRLFLFIGIPSIVLVGINTYFIEKKHGKHLEEHPPKFTPYEHMKIRTKVNKRISISISIYLFLFVF